MCLQTDAITFYPVRRGSANCHYTLCHFVAGRKDHGIVEMWSSETIGTGYVVCVEILSLHTSLVKSPEILSLSFSTVTEGIAPGATQDLARNFIL